MTKIVVLEFLDHHGVKGQKWGVRQKVSSSSFKGDARTQHQKNQDRDMTETFLSAVGSKKMKELEEFDTFGVDDLVSTYNTMKYSRHWYRINKTLNFIVEMNQ